MDSPAPTGTPPVRFYCPRHGCYTEPGTPGERERRMQSGEVIRECLGCRVQRLYNAMKDGR